MLETSQFTFNKETRTLVTEASSLGLEPGLNFKSMMIQSSDTGLAASFLLFQTHRNADGEITHWEYLPTGNLKNVSKVVVFND
jgi:hypothetical protein